MAPLDVLRSDSTSSLFLLLWYRSRTRSHIGVEIVSQDFLERGNIDFRALKFRVLDEADEMLRMGFVEDVELILGM